MKNLKLIALVFLAVLALIFGCVSTGIAETYEPTIPDAWKPSLSVGELTIDCNAFYGVSWSFGLYPVVRLHFPVENLTSKPLYFKVNYRTESKIKGYGNSGMGVRYSLGPREKRLIDTIAPIASLTRPIRFILRMSDPFHELAHIFSYHFPGYGSAQGGIVEAFAAYFEPHNMAVGPTRQILKRRLSQGKLSPLDDVLLSNSSSQELVILIDFLLNRDVEKFKTFYVHVTRTRNKAGMEKACQQIYGTDLKGLEKQWHEYIKR